MNKNILLEADNKSFNQRDWATEYSQLSTDSDREKLIDEFISSFLISKNIPEIKFRNALKSYLLLGAPDSLNKNNPFLLWINLYNQKVRAITDIDDDDFNNLINLHGNQIILDEDLTGTGRLGTKSIIFNSDLFKQSEQDLTYLTQVFYWLDVSNNSKRLFDHLKNMSQEDKLSFFKELKGKFFRLDEITPEDLKYRLIFKYGSYNSNGELLKAIDIQNALDYLDSHVQKGDQEEEREYTKEEKEILNRIIKNLSNPKQFRYTEQQVKSILDMLLKSNKINMGMSFDDLQNSVYNSLLKNFGSGR